MTRWVAFAMGVAAVALLAASGHITLPRLLVWLLAVMLFWAAGTLWFRTIDWRRAAMPTDDRSIGARDGGPASALRPGESYVPAVRLRLAPNVPLAEALCMRLREAGIEAFLKRVSTTVAIGGGTSDFGPAEIWVQADRVDDANALLGPE
jgi:hypothetical protein